MCNSFSEKRRMYINRVLEIKFRQVSLLSYVSRASFLESLSNYISNQDVTKKH